MRKREKISAKLETMHFLLTLSKLVLHCVYKLLKKRVYALYVYTCLRKSVWFEL